MPPVSNGPISATYNTTTELLQLIFRLDLGEGTISIRQNEEEIISPFWYMKKENVNTNKINKNITTEDVEKLYLYRLSQCK